jgi:alpha-N-arabinofuranosidase
VSVASCPQELDVTASRSGGRIYLHVVNTERTKARAARLGVEGARIRSGRVYTLAAEHEHEILEDEPGVLEPVEAELPEGARWTFPAASVSAVELEVDSMPGGLPPSPPTPARTGAA